MELLEEFSWGDGQILPKLLGSYECELHPWISRVSARAYDTIVDVGCAEGYYAVGLARSSASTAQVLAFDVDADARRLCWKSAEKNEVSDRIKVLGQCSPASLEEALEHGGRSFAIFDCEGSELELLVPDLVPMLRETDILVECHDRINPAITETLYSRLSPTHSIRRVDEESRDFRQYPFLEGLSGLERSLALCEFRAEAMHWLLFSSKSRKCGLSDSRIKQDQCKTSSSLPPD
jgi:precorrin-6B methylase 2